MTNKDWFKAYLKKDVEELHTGILGKRQDGLFASAGKVTPKDHPNNLQVSSDCHLVPARNDPDDDVICLSMSNVSSLKRSRADGMVSTLR